MELADFNGDGRLDVIVSGKGATILLQASSVSIFPNKLAFPKQAVGTNSAAKSILLTNTGGLDVKLTGITISDPNKGDFSALSSCSTTLLPGGQCTVTVTFSPSAIGARTAFLHFIDDAEANPQTVKLSGTGY